MHKGSMEIRRIANMAAHSIFNDSLYGHAQGTHAKLAETLVHSIAYRRSQTLLASTRLRLGDSLSELSSTCTPSQESFMLQYRSSSRRNCQRNV